MWEALGKEVFGCLAHLPVAIRERPLEGGVDLGAGERSECDDGAPADGGLVHGGRKDRGQRRLVADGSERSDSSLTAERILMARGDGAQRRDGTGLGRYALAARPGRGFDDRGVGIGEQRQERHLWPGIMSGHLLGDPSPHLGRGIAGGSGDIVGGQRPKAPQRTQRHGAGAGVAVSEQGASRRLVARVARQCGLSPLISLRFSQDAPECARLGFVPTGRSTTVSHMVIYRTADGQPGYHQTEALDDAVSFVERLRNGDGVDHARIFRMEEVAFDFKPYFRVEVGGEARSASAPTAPQMAPAPAPAPLLAPFSDAAPVGPVAGGPAEGGGWMDLPSIDEPAAASPPVAEPLLAEPFGAPEPVGEAPPFGEPEHAAPVFETLPPPPPPPPGMDDESAGSSNGMGARRGLFGR